MTTRAESAAATGRALLDAASALLDEGGAEAVTLRAVGSKAGVSRGAPYGHFADKETLLAALAIRAWTQLANDLEQIQAEESPSGQARLTRAVLAFVTVARQRPHLYSLMFTTPSKNPQPLIDAASKAQDAFLSIVGEVVGQDDARRVGALLMSTAHGVAGMESSGQLGESKWGTTGDRIIIELIGLLGHGD